MKPHHVQWIKCMHQLRGKLSQILQNMTKDLYISVMKEPKDGSADDREALPPAPPHTVEDLYTAVMKMPKGKMKDKKEASPIPPYIVEEN